MEASSSRSNVESTEELPSPPRSSDSDWSDIDTEEENNLTDDDDATDKLFIDLPKKRKQSSNETESVNSNQSSALKM